MKLPPRVRRVLADESGMTLVEMLDVLVILGILLSVAVPSYLSMRDRANQAAAKSNLRAVMPAVSLYGADNQPNTSLDPDSDPSTTGYTNLSPTLLKSLYDPTIDTSKYAVANASDSTFCIYTWVDAWTASQLGPDGHINVTLSSAFDPLSCR